MEDNDNKKGRFAPTETPRRQPRPAVPVSVDPHLGGRPDHGAPCFGSFANPNKTTSKKSPTASWSRRLRKRSDGVVKKGHGRCRVDFAGYYQRYLLVPAKNGVEQKDVYFAAKVKYSDEIYKFFKAHNISLEYTEANRGGCDYDVGIAATHSDFAVIYFVFIRQIKLAGKGR